MVGGLRDLTQKILDAGEFAAVCRYGDGLCTWAFVREGVESVAGGAAGVGFAGSDVDF